MEIIITPAMKVTKNDGDNSETEYITFTDFIRVTKKDGETVEGVFVHLNYDKVVIIVDKPTNIQISDIENIEKIS